MSKLDYLKVWITIPTRYLKGRDRDKLLREFKRDIKQLKKQFESYGVKPVVAWFDPLFDSWGQEYKSKIDHSDLLLFYHKSGNCFFGKGAARIYDDYYGVKPNFIMYRTQGTRKLKYYEPLIKLDLSEHENYHKWYEMTFGVSRSPKEIVELCEENNTYKARRTPNTAPLAEVSKYKYLYHSIFNDYG